jgi:hypothetical protein
MKLSRLEEWSKIVEEQRAWIKSRGGDLQGYIATYGSKTDPDHFGDGGEAIYAADVASLRKYEAEFDKVEKASRRAEAKIPGVCGACGRAFVDLEGGVKGCVVHSVKSPLSIYDRINIGVYKNTKPYPSTSLKTEYGDRLRKEYREEEGKLNAEFKRDLFEYFGVLDNPKRDKCFELAWAMGHSSGYSEIAIYFQDLVELIK